MKWEEQQRGERSYGVFGSASSHFSSPPSLLPASPSLLLVSEDASAVDATGADVEVESYFPAASSSSSMTTAAEKVATLLPLMDTSLHIGAIDGDGA